MAKFLAVRLRQWGLHLRHGQPMDKRLGCFMWHGESELYLEATWVVWVQFFTSETGWSGPSCSCLLGRWTGMCRANMPIRRALSRGLIAHLQAHMLLRHSVQPSRPRLFHGWAILKRQRIEALQNCKPFTQMHNITQLSRDSMSEHCYYGSSCDVLPVSVARNPWHLCT